MGSNVKLASPRFIVKLSVLCRNLQQYILLLRLELQIKNIQDKLEKIREDNSSPIILNSLNNIC